MSNALQVMADTIRDPRTTGRLALALGFDDAKSDKAKTEAAKYAASVLAELEKMATDEKKRAILECSPMSIIQVMVDAAKFKLMIDGRQYAHIVKYGKEATLQIGYRGYLAKITEHFDDADINVFPVYEGDTLTISGDNGFDTYAHNRLNPFEESLDKFKGMCAVLYYKKGDKEFQKVITMTAREIGQIRKSAKQDFVWSAWFIEKAKAAAVKRICKLQFASISILQDMISYDNEKHHDIEKAQTENKAGSIVDNLNKGISGASDDVIDVDVKDITPKEEKPSIRPEIEKLATSIRQAINFEETIDGLDLIFSQDFKADFDLLKKESPSLFQELVDEIEKKRQSL